ncbi:UDP-N-acetylmuramate dehydrogenase [Poriferisphaera sp. WC338]|uniref:UDP-N-acetylmuramate dehydrogenase n=1 Tax=Poriferisphaera sp. WC338 TaxID=3425129 RepID=UPI003D81B76E
MTWTYEKELRDWLPGIGCDVEWDTDLGARTWYAVGGKCAALAHPKDEVQLEMVVQGAHERGVPMYVLGSGANLLVLSKGVDGVVVLLDDEYWQEYEIKVDEVVARGGCDLMKLVRETAKAGQAGLEVLAGIPASVGGAVRMNAGGAFGEIGSSVKWVRVMDVRGEVRVIDRDELCFSYRHTNVVEPLILEVGFELAGGDATALMQRVKEIFLYKKNSQPMGANSAGCAFKNPSSSSEGEAKGAGQLIDEAGLKGYRIGRAQVSEVHANFITADKKDDDPKVADEVFAVMCHAQEVVHERFGIELVREVVVWPAPR